MLSELMTGLTEQRFYYSMLMAHYTRFFGGEQREAITNL